MIAFKEWATLVEVLARGEQILILRKGGIHEKGKKFDVAHEQFFLFPTFEHQNPGDLKPHGQKILEQVLRTKPGEGQIPIRYFATVLDSFWISEENDLAKLDPFHVWSPECIRSRFHWGEEKGLFGIVVRVEALSEVALLPSLPRYGGCRSWVDLEHAPSTVSLNPVLSESLFREQQKKIAETLKIPA